MTSHLMASHPIPCCPDDDGGTLKSELRNEPSDIIQKQRKRRKKGLIYQVHHHQVLDFVGPSLGPSLVQDPIPIDIVSPASRVAPSPIKPVSTLDHAPRSHSPVGFPMIHGPLSGLCLGPTWSLERRRPREELHPKLKPQSSRPRFIIRVGAMVPWSHGPVCRSPHETLIFRNRAWEIHQRDNSSSSKSSSLKASPPLSSAASTPSRAGSGNRPHPSDLSISPLSPVPFPLRAEFLPVLFFGSSPGEFQVSLFPKRFQA
ncbi:hypothetical protein BKA56DRAFT_28536 [Ilyonectria sp. MPI-CAGE-AT-0026]|nr:hypothetical protein BKA56DRAFT_28536 [Ilyonectria sp. MPI-CAGE-AT-0026]